MVFFQAVSQGIQTFSPGASTSKSEGANPAVKKVQLCENPAQGHNGQIFLGLPDLTVVQNLHDGHCGKSTCPFCKS
jgi:hypothetical protein